MDAKRNFILLALVAGAVLVGAGIGFALDRPPGQAQQPSSAALEREERARSAMAGVALTVELEQADFFAAGAVADFGIEEGVRRVIVRIAHRLDVRVTVQAAHDVAFGAVPVICLVGPDAAPDDAGLESPCWGRPDVSDFLATQLTIDQFGHPLLLGSAPVSFQATLWRSGGTCDYAPGEWEVRLWADVVVDGHHTGEMFATPTSFEVPVPADPGPLRLVDPEDSRFCGLASRIYREQGEPETVTP